MNLLMVAVGTLVGVLGVISPASLSKGLTRIIPSHRHHLIPVSEKAIRKGLEILDKTGKFQAEQTS